MLLLRPYQVTNPIWVHLSFFFFFKDMMGFQIYDYCFLRPSIATREEEEEASQTNKKEEAAES